jgi:glucosyl-dolichyl phosphate glucuronosyltransferase
MKFEISVVICTHNRAGYLRKALEGLRGQSLSPCRFETIVIDNASTDPTAEVVRQSLDTGFENLRYVFEPTLGLSVARNTGWRTALGEIVAFLDDDAIPSACWVERIGAAFKEVKPRPACVGGRIYPIWELPRPNWLPDELLGYLTIVDWFQAPTVLDVTKHFVAGANMAFLRSALHEIGGFDPQLGRVGDRLISGEELLAQRELASRGYTIYYDPSAAVGHHVVASRLKRSWFYERVFAEGVSEAVLRGRSGQYSRQHKTLAAVRSLTQVLSRPRLAVGLILPAITQKAVTRRCTALHWLGLARGYLSA